MKCETRFINILTSELSKPLEEVSSEITLNWDKKDNERRVQINHAFVSHK
jgi:hypothetical protein